MPGFKVIQKKHCVAGVVTRRSMFGWFYYCGSSIFGLTEELMGSVITKINVMKAFL